jgi:Ca-activated chloride channel family protein
MVQTRRTTTAFVIALAGALALTTAACSAPTSGPTSQRPAPNQGNGGANGGGGNGNGGSGHYEGEPTGPDIRSDTDPGREPRSTFAVDVDTASYGFVRRQILDGMRPDPGTVRPEEFLNAFRQDYAQPSGDGFTVNVDGARLPGTHGRSRDDGQGETRLLRVGLQTRAEDEGARNDAALTFVVDVSGSMAEPNKLDLVQDALHTLINQLRPTDQVAIVAYDDTARVLREMTPVRDQERLHAAVDRLSPGGSTNLEAGLVTGYEVAREGFVPGATNRVILLSDGLANVGNTSAEPILRQVRENAGKKIALLGVGVGSDYGDELMERLADEGDGFVVYVDDLAQARQLFVYRLPATLAVRALDAKVQVTFDPNTVANYRLIGYDNRALDARDFRNDRVDGGEVGPGHSVTALYVVRLRPDAVERAGGATVAQARVRWMDPRTREATERATTITVRDLGGDFAGASPRLQVDYTAAYFAEVLRRSPYGDEVDLVDLARIAEDAFHATDDPQVDDLAELITRTR